MFLQLSVILFTGGGSASVHAGIPPFPLPSRHPTGAGTPPVQCMLGYMVNKRAVCILLECNLVSSDFIVSRKSVMADCELTR